MQKNIIVTGTCSEYIEIVAACLRSHDINCHAVEEYSFTIESLEKIKPCAVLVTNVMKSESLWTKLQKMYDEKQLCEVKVLGMTGDYLSDYETIYPFATFLPKWTWSQPSLKQANDLVSLVRDRLSTTVC